MQVTTILAGFTALATSAYAAIPETYAQNAFSISKTFATISVFEDKECSTGVNVVDITEIGITRGTLPTRSAAVKLHVNEGARCTSK